MGSNLELFLDPNPSLRRRKTLNQGPEMTQNGPKIPLWTKHLILGLSGTGFWSELTEKIPVFGQEDVRKGAQNRPFQGDRICTLSGGLLRSFSLTKRIKGVKTLSTLKMHPLSKGLAQIYMGAATTHLWSRCHSGGVSGSTLPPPPVRTSDHLPPAGAEHARTMQALSCTLFLGGV